MFLLCALRDLCGENAFGQAPMRIAINGYGRIGRSFVRALAEREGAGWKAPFSLVAINDRGRPEDLLYLTRYDTTHGRLSEPAELIEGMLRIGQQAPRLASWPSSLG